jgi:hypothetical protein
MLGGIDQVIYIQALAPGEADSSRFHDPNSGRTLSQISLKYQTVYSGDEEAKIGMVYTIDLWRFTTVYGGLPRRSDLGTGSAVTNYPRN